LQCKLQHHAPKKAELDSECRGFDEFPELRFEFAATLEMRNSQVICKTKFVAGFQFREEFLLLELNAVFLLATKIALIHFKTPEIAKMLHNVYKG
jgi:hypothetical protein